MGECFLWYRPTRVVPDQRPLNGRCCCCYSCILLIIYVISKEFSPDLAYQKLLKLVSFLSELFKKYYKGHFLEQCITYLRIHCNEEGIMIHDMKS